MLPISIDGSSLSEKYTATVLLGDYPWRALERLTNCHGQAERILVQKARAGSLLCERLQRLLPRLRVGYMREVGRRGRWGQNRIELRIRRCPSVKSFWKTPGFDLVDLLKLSAAILKAGYLDFYAGNTLLRGLTHGYPKR